MYEHVLVCICFSFTKRDKMSYFNLTVDIFTGLMSFPDLILEFEKKCRSVSESIRFVHNYSACVQRTFYDVGMFICISIK